MNQATFSAFIRSVPRADRLQRAIRILNERGRARLFRRLSRYRLGRVL